MDYLPTIDIYPKDFNNLNILIKCIFLKMDYLRSHIMKKHKKKYLDILYIDEKNNFYVSDGESHFSIEYYTFPCGVKQLDLYQALYIPSDAKIIKRKID